MENTSKTWADARFFKGAGAGWGWFIGLQNQRGIAQKCGNLIVFFFDILFFLTVQ